MAHRPRNVFNVSLKFVIDSPIEATNSQIQEREDWLSATPPNNPGKPIKLYELGKFLHERMLKTDAFDDLKRAIEAVEMAIKLIDTARVLEFIEYSSLLGVLYCNQYWQSHATRDIDRAIEATRAVVDAIMRNDTLEIAKARYFCDHANNLVQRAMLYHSLDGLEDAIVYVELASDLCNSLQERGFCQYSMSILLSLRFFLTTEAEDLNQAVKAAEHAAAITESDETLFNLAEHLATRFCWTGQLEDIIHANQAASIATELIPNWFHKPASMFKVASLLGLKFGETREMEDLNIALDLATKVVTAVSPNSPDSAGAHSLLAELLGICFQYTGSKEHIDGAIEMAEKAVLIPNVESITRAIGLYVLGIGFYRRFRAFGKREDIDRAIANGSAAVDAVDSTHPFRSACMSSLAESLFNRYTRIGMKADLDYAIRTATEAIGILPTIHPNRSLRLNNLSTYLGQRAEWTGIVDRDLAVRLAEESVSSATLSTRHSSGNLDSLALHICRRFHLTKNTVDIDRAVEVAHKAVEINAIRNPTPESDERCFYALGTSLFARFQHLRVSKDLDQAIDAFDKAVNRTSDDSANRGFLLFELALGLIERICINPSWKDFQLTVRSFEVGWYCSNTPPSIRVRFAIGLSQLYNAEYLQGVGSEDSNKVLQDAIELLPTVSPRSLRNVEKQRILRQYSHLASAAAESALRAGKEAYHALKLLEMSRNVIAGLLLETRTDISELANAYPSLAREFTELRDELDSVNDSISLGVANLETESWISRTDRRNKMEIKFKHVIDEIRTQPSFHNFLLPPGPEEMMAAAELGPIVVLNLSVFRGDAFLIESHQIRAIPLAGLNSEEMVKNVQKMNHCLQSEASAWRVKFVLEWIWDVIACPVLMALGFTKPVLDDKWPTLWWVPTGALCHLPLHAAGRIYRDSQEIVLSRVISCYSTSVKALIHSRQQRQSIKDSDALDNALLVEMCETPDLAQEGKLPFAKEEIAILEQILPELALKPLRPNPRKQDVLDGLHRSKVFHFAGHGFSDAIEPSQSCLLLEDWKSDPLTVDDLRSTWLKDSSPFLSYLSACSTGANRTNQLLQEGIHLISSFQLAGFRHVIGTLWEVSDKHSVDVAKIVYQTLRDEGMTDKAVAYGLHKATRALLNSDLVARGARRTQINAVAEVTRSAKRTEAENSGKEFIKVVSPDWDSISRKFKDLRHFPGGRAVNESTLSDRILDVDFADREERDLTLVTVGANANGSTDTDWEPPLFWVPYVHYGA